MRKFLLLMFLFTLALSISACGCGDDDDDNDSDSTPTDDTTGDDTTGDDDDTTGDDDTGSDTEPPVIQNTTVLIDTFDTAGPYSVQADVTDNVGLASVQLFYRVDGGDFTAVAMAVDTGDTYGADIPGQATGGFVEYYVQAEDASTNTADDPADAPTSLYSFYVFAESTIQYDDGSNEDTIAAGGEGSYVFLRVTPTTYPAYLLSMSYYCVAATAQEAVPYVLIDETGSGAPPDISEAISAGGEFAPLIGAWTEIDLTSIMELTDPILAGDYYIGFFNYTGTPAWGWDADYTDDYRVWLWSIGDSSWHNVTWNDGVVMYRAGIAAP